MLLYLGGETVYNHKEKRVVLYIGKILYEENDVIESVYSIFNGKDMINMDGSDLGHIFDTCPQDMLRTIYYGDFCNMNMTEGLDEDYVIENKKKISLHLKQVDKKILNKNLFIKEFVE